MKITSRWHKQLAAAQTTDDEAQQCISDLRAAHWLILHADLLAHITTRGGMQFEWGYANCRGMLCVVIGDMSMLPLFTQLPNNLVYPTWEEFVRFLKGS